MRSSSIFRLIVLLALVGGAAVYVQPAAAATTDCPKAPASRLVIGRQARVTPVGAPNNLRAKPSLSAQIVDKVDVNELVDVTDGPTCADGYAWWQVSYNTESGWMAEGSGTKYYMEPTTSDITEFDIADNDTSVDVQFENVGFTYNGAFGNSVEADTVFAFKGDPNNPLISAAPQFTDFLLKSATITDPYSEAHLSVYPVKDYEKINDQAKQRVDALKQILDTKPKTFTDEIPVLPVVPAGQVFRSNIKYVDFNGGSGVSFVTMYAQDVSPITSDRLRFMFQGLTDDGNYLITANFPIASDVVAATYDDAKDFPDVSGPNAGDLFQAYLDKTVAKLNKATPDHFTPNLDDLHSLLQSINIQAASQ